MASCINGKAHNRVQNFARQSSGHCGVYDAHNRNNKLKNLRLLPSSGGGRLWQALLADTPASAATQTSFFFCCNCALS